MNSISLEVDYREHRIIELLNNVDKTVVNLPIGDFVIKKDDQIVYVIERKTMQDLAASIIDGRFREQKTRLLESVIDSKKIIYIIEGYKSSIRNIPKKTIDSALLNLVLIHNYTVIYTENIQDTCDILLMLIEKCKTQNPIQEGEVLKHYGSVTLLKKNQFSTNKTPLMIHILCIIPGIGVQIATVLEQTYKSIKTLLETSSTDLAAIQVTEKRKVGHVIAKKIISAFTNQ